MLPVASETRWFPFSWRRLKVCWMGEQGVVGLAAAAMGGDVCMTDREEAAIELAKFNVDANRRHIAGAGGSCRVEMFDWTHPPAPLVDRPWQVCTARERHSLGDTVGDFSRRLPHRLPRPREARRLARRWRGGGRD